MNSSRLMSSLLVAWFIGLCGGWVIGRLPLQTQLAQLKAAHAQEREQAATAAAKALTEAQTRGDLLTAGLLTQQNQINKIKAEKDRAITQATTGSACLREPALRLLSSAPGISVVGLPPATGSAAATGAAAAADPDAQDLVATDTDVTGWSVDAGAKYEICRARLDALVDWHPNQP